MKFFGPFSLLFCILAITVGSLAQPAPAADTTRTDIESARKAVYPALVNITVITKFYNGGRVQRAPAGGSGVIVNKEGYVLTNFHVAGNTTRITCTLPDGDALDATPVTQDPLTDLTVLKLDLGRRKPGSPPLPFAVLGDSDSLKVGDYVLAMGNPLMLASSMTLGIVSNTKRVFTDFTGTEMEDMELDGGEKTGLFTRWIQHDALILPGNSGGPLVSLKGEVVGINELGGNGVGFAIPSNIAANVLKQALSGGIKRGWLGISVLPVRKLGLDEGALISAVWPNSPAAKGGIKPGDILLTLDRAAVNVRFFEEAPLFYQQVAVLQVGSSIPLTYRRDGNVSSTTVVVAPMEKSTGDEDENKALGVTVQEITEPFARASEMPDKNGVYVTGVRPSYPFNNAQPPILTGDVVLAIGGTPTSDLAAFKKVAAAQTSGSFVVTIRRDDEQILSVVHIEPDKRDPESKELPKAWLGIKTQVMVPDVAQAMHLAGVRGFRITQVYPYTEAGKCGLKTGDVITAVNKDKLTAFRAQDSDDLKSMIDDLPIGDKEQITVVRDGKPLILSVVMDKEPDPIDHAQKVKQLEFEFAVREIMPLDRMEREWTINQKGVIVTDATQGGWSAVAGLETEDVILAINGIPINDVPGFESVMKTMLAKRPTIIQIFVKRGPITHYVFIEPEWAHIPVGK